MSAILSFMQAKCEPIPHKIRDKRGKKQKSGEQQTFKDQTPTYENYRNSPILLEIIANLMDWKPSLDPEW